MTTPPDEIDHAGQSVSDRFQLEDVARHLGVTKQRVHQLAAERGFPRSDTGQGLRVWDRATIVDWADRKWWGSKPWRTAPGTQGG